MGIVESLAKKAKPNKKLIEDVYNRVVRYNSDSLYSDIPDQRVKFSVNDMVDIIKSTGLSVEDMKNAVSKSSYMSNDRAVSSAPLNLSMGLLVFMYHKKDPKFVKLVNILMGMRFYSSLHIKYYRTIPNASVMRAALNDMYSNNDIRKYKTVFGFIQHKALSNYANMAGIDYKTNKRKGVDRIAKADDKSLHELIVGVYSRLNNSMRNSISKKFYKAHEEGKYHNEVSDENVPEWAEELNVSHSIVRYAFKATHALENKVDSTMIKDAARDTTVSYQALTVIASSICRKEHDRVYLCCLNIVGLFLSEGKNKPSMLGSRFFEDSCETLYQQNNAKDERIRDIKKILEELLLIHYEDYSHLKRVATKSNYKKAIYLIFVKAISATNR